MTPSTFGEIIEDRLKHVEAAVALIENGEGDRPELDNLRGHLIDILDIIERNPGIEAAADDLYDIAARAVTGSARERSSVSRERRIVSLPSRGVGHMAGGGRRLGLTLPEIGLSTPTVANVTIPR